MRWARARIDEELKYEGEIKETSMVLILLFVVSSCRTIKFAAGAGWHLRRRNRDSTKNNEVETAPYASSLMCIDDDFSVRRIARGSYAYMGRPLQQAQSLFMFVKARGLLKQA